MRFRVLPLATDAFDLVLGTPWLHLHNPLIDWQARTIEIHTFGEPIVLHQGGSLDHPYILSHMAFSRALKKGQLEEAWLVHLKPIDSGFDGEVTTPETAEAAKWSAEILSHFDDVMREELPPEPPPPRGVAHAIPTDPGAVPPCRAPYRLGPKEEAEMRRQIRS